MRASSPSARARRAGVAALVIALGGPLAAATAGPGTYHTAVGSGVEYEPGACTGTGPCPVMYGSYFSIDASDRPGSLGWMRVNEVSVTLTCVVVEHSQLNHKVYAAGYGADGKRYNAMVTPGTAVAAGSFIVSTMTGSSPCGVSMSYDFSGYGSFAVASA